MTQAQIDLEKISQHLNSNGSSPWTWVFYGDSATHGAAHTRGFRAFPEIFAERVRWELRLLYDVVINTAISGQTTVHLLDEKFYEWRVRRFNPDAVSILIGGNDIIHLKNPDQFRDNLVELVRRVRADNAIPLLQTYGKILPVPEKEEYMIRYNKWQEYNQIIRDAAAAESVILIDNNKYWNDNIPDEKTLKFWLGESIHPGGKGHLEIAKCIFQTFGIYNPESLSANPIGTPWSLAE